MGPRELTVLAAVKAGEERALAAVLDAIGDDVRGHHLATRASRVHVHFERARTVHFARLALLPDPDRGDGRRRLLFASVYDGPLADHLAELAALTTDLDALWGRCEGFPGRAGFADYLRARAVAPAAFYRAFRDLDAARIRADAALRDQLEAMFDAGDPARLWPAAGSGEARRRPFLHAVVDASARFGAWLRRGLAGVGRGLLVGWDLLVATLRFGPGNVWWAGRKVAATLGRLPLIGLFNRLTWNELPPPAVRYTAVEVDGCAPCAPGAPGDEVVSADAADLAHPRREDQVSQNQLTLVTVVDPRQLDRLRAVMAVIATYSRRLAPPGSLAGISTIHFVRWLILDDGKRLLMLSDYDGSWEAYIGEFAEMILSGLDAIWGSALGFPPAGAQDVAAFKRFLRCHQIQSNVFYSAYPEETVLTITANRTIAEGAGQALRPEDPWLRLL